MPAVAQDPAPQPQPQHALTQYGDPPRYGPDFQHFDYADPNAPQGGSIVLPAFGTFDSLNPFVLRGTAATGIPLIYQTLTESSADEAAVEYGSLAQTITVAPDRSWVTFALHPEARWHDGQPITADDVVWSFETLKNEGAPFYRAYYAEVTRAEALDPHTVRFTFARPGNTELPLIMGQLTVLPRHWWQGRDFQNPTLDPPLGSGPYRIAAVDPGQSVTFERVPDWWARDLPVNRGRYNIGTIRYDYYRDMDVMFEAFLGGRYDFRVENVSRNWATAYDVPAVREGRMLREAIPNEDSQGMQGFVFNTRRPMFADRRVRQALNLLFDFEWLNRNLFYGIYTRCNSYFSNSELAATGLPSPEELAILEPFRGQIPDEVFTQEYREPVTDGSGNIRDQMRQAVELLRQAGWEVRNGRMTHVATGQPFTFEILLVQASLDRVTQPFVRNLERLGITASVRVVDTSQYVNRVNDHDYDMISFRRLQSLSPGNEQRDQWGSATADEPGSDNLPGVRDPVIDRLIDLIVTADSRATLIARVRALDRVLLWGHYVIPHWYNDHYLVAYWNRFGHPEQPPRYGLGFPTVWWVDPARDAALRR